MDNIENKVRVLIAEDETSLRTILKKTFLKKGFEVETAPDGELALAQLKSKSFDLAILDLKMPHRDGFEVLKYCRKEISNLPIILMTAQDTMKNAVEAMKQGAFDYITKPFELEELELIVDRALETQKLANEVKQLRSEIKEHVYDKQAKMIGQSKAIREIYKMIGKVSASDVPVFISGESGTGKELIAKSIHQSSNRNHRPFIAVNCAAIPKDLLESELFGYRKGAFTGANESRSGYFEAAHTGTLFLDEIGDMPSSLQSKLLRALQEKEITRLGSTEPIKIDVRVISATNQDLSKMVAEKRFREDLYFRLNVVPITVPPLRERKEDIEILASHFLERFSDELQIPHRDLSADALDLLQKYFWPGNVRELENVIKRAIVLSHATLIRAKDLKSILKEPPSTSFNSKEMEDTSLEELVHAKLSKFLNRFDQLGTLDLYEVILPMV
ncbi:MAG: sigma-54-dependent Fis family transcriptional regulator, partial [Deltaproteobacteria bacterium]|nr:sigma-54-dependent Fis family transcriptional regulator [Deltaproteobacteria bacterium]